MVLIELGCDTGRTFQALIIDMFVGVLSKLHFEYGCDFAHEFEFVKDLLVVAAALGDSASAHEHRQSLKKLHRPSSQ